MFNTIQTLYSYPSGPMLNSGLNYYGYTIIMPNSLMQFCEILQEIKMGVEFEKLVLLCETAYERNVAVLHCGI